MSISYWSLLGDALHRLTPRDYGHIGHAGQTETSIQLHLQPEHVDPGWSSITDWADLAPLAEGLATPGAYSPPLPKVEAPKWDLWRCDGCVRPVRRRDRKYGSRSTYRVDHAVSRSGDQTKMTFNWKGSIVGVIAIVLGVLWILQGTDSLGQKAAA